jgi:hypothetical protein
MQDKDSSHNHAANLLYMKEYENSVCLYVDEILRKELVIKGFYSNVINYKSIYNNQNQITDNDIYRYSKKLGRVHFFEHFLIWFEEYFTNYVSKIQKLMNEDGFISIPWRYYVALMAVSTMKSKCLFKILEEKFLENGGDESWLIFGLDVIPEKLNKLSKINNLLAHQPWVLNTEDIKVIYKK